MNKENVAKIAHEVNRAYCEALGDNSQLPWDECPDWQKESAIAGVEFHSNNQDAGPESSHESWLAQKVADGWVFGEEKNAELKTHHCIVPFAELPVEQQAKDFIFRAVVHSIISVLKEWRKDTPATPVITGKSADLTKETVWSAIVETLDAHATEKNIDELLTDAVMQVIESVQPTRLAIQYIGRRPSYSDGLYDTGEWLKYQVKLVDVAIAKKMLEHPDVYGTPEVVAADVEIVGTDKAPSKDTPDDAPHLDAARESVMGMRTIKTVQEFVANNFSGAKLEMPKGTKINAYRLEAIRMIDKYHVPEA